MADDSFDSNLSRLRDKYVGLGGGTVFDPHFQEIAAKTISPDGRRRLPYSDPATFMAAPYRQNAFGTLDGLKDLDVALIGVPMDLGVTNRSGCRLGPRAVRAVERIGPYEHVLRVAPMGMLRVADVGDVPLRSRYSLESCHEDIEAAYKAVVAAGVIPLSVGGDHSISQAILKAVGEKRPVGLIHIDAHSDTAGEYEGSRFHHGGPFRQAVLDGAVDPRRTLQIGIRGTAEYLYEFSTDSGMTVVHAEEVEEHGIRRYIDVARQLIGDGPVYISFDIDSVDPGFAPGTGTPEVGGLQPREVLALLRGLKGLDIVGGDVVEVAPQYDATSNTAHIAAQVLFEMLSLVALREKPSI
ncbi:agmatinase [Acidisoma silvae]|uniref:Agmatinase n=1 Tax=Acidisoma silvae TaxID=2802396 RepID=A0A963YRH9_9PROT|nr:agmatinase [Acidisoma silvae]MCB8875000.1 agmatinase [Acidisoma silvae]